MVTLFKLSGKCLKATILDFSHLILGECVDLNMCSYEGKYNVGDTDAGLASGS